MMGNDMALFLAGLFLANGIPHFVNGISGRNFHNPFLHRFMPTVPSPLFNVIWGLLNFCLVIFILTRIEGLNFQVGREAILAGSGFAFAAVGLSLLFNRPIKPTP